MDRVVIAVSVGEDGLVVFCGVVLRLSGSPPDQHIPLIVHHRCSYSTV